MRGTGSHTVFLEDVFVPDEAIALRRPCGRWHPAWSVIVTVALPIFMAAYVGVAEAAAAIAREQARGRRDDPLTAPEVGELETGLAAARLAWEGMVTNAAGYRFVPEAATADAALVRKTLCARAAMSTVDRAVGLCGGRAFFRTSALERLYRDVRGAPFHPLPGPQQARFTGRLALGLDPVTGEPV